MRTLKSLIFPAIIGNILEWYDFTIYAYFATGLAALYFPHQDKLLSLIETYGLFAASYFMRPLGAIVFGYFGDKFGRKISLSYSVIIMGCCSIAIAILPTHATWGALAGISLALIRLIQGFAVGGEYSGASIYLIEFSPPNQRTFFGSLSLMGAYSGFLLSSMVGTLLSAALTSSQLMSFGWRLAFILGALITILGFYMRRKLQETPEFLALKNSKNKARQNPLKSLLYYHPKTLMLALGIAVLPAGFSYIVFVFLPNYLTTYAGFTSNKVFEMNTIAMSFVVVLVPVIGFIADKIGRKILMLTSAVLIMFLCIPISRQLLHDPVTVLILLGALNVMFEANIPTEIAELFYSDFRYTGLALTLNLTNGIAGGFAPIIGTLLIYETGLIISPMFYVVFLSVITLSCLARNIFHTSDLIQQRENQLS